MVSYAKDAPRLDKVILIVACALAVLVVGQMAFWENRQQAMMDRQQETLERLTDIISMQRTELAALRERVETNRRELDRGR